MDISIEQETCCTCNVIFWITSKHQEQLKSCHNSFYCPNGHRQSYRGETDAQKTENLERDLRYEKRSSTSLTRSNSALRGVITKIKKVK